MAVSAPAATQGEGLTRESMSFSIAVSSVGAPIE